MRADAKIALHTSDDPVFTTVDDLSDKWRVAQRHAGMARAGSNASNRLLESDQTIPEVALLVYWVWIAICVTVGLAAALASARQRRLLRPVRETFALADDDLVWSCGFKLRRPTTYVATFGFAQVHLRDDVMCVRSVVMRHSAYCVRRAEARIEVRRIQGVRGLRVLGEKIDFDLAVGGLPSLIERLNELGWAVDATG